VKTYTIYVHDSRARAPVRLSAELAHDERAHEFARERLASSRHHIAVEVWDGAQRLCRVSPTDPRAAKAA